MVVLNDPVEIADAPERALRMAWAMKHACEAGRLAARAKSIAATLNARHWDERRGAYE